MYLKKYKNLKMIAILANWAYFKLAAEKQCLVANLI